MVTAKMPNSIVSDRPHDPEKQDLPATPHATCMGAAPSPHAMHATTAVTLLLALGAVVALPVGEAATPGAPAQTKPATPTFPAFGATVPEFKPAFIIRGPIPKNFDDDALHVVAMFSTRLTSSLKSIPHLNDLHVKYAARGVRVTGVSVWEESDSAVRDFLTERGDSLRFPVCFDGRDAGGTVSRLWQEASFINAVPYLFVVRKNKVLWHGAPDELDAATFETMVAGTYDPAAENARREAIEAARAKAAPISEAIEDLLAENKPDAALAKCDELERALPECDKSLATRMRAECYFEKGDFKAGFAQAAKFADAHPKDAQLHAMLALQIVSEPRFKSPDFELAKRSVNRALELTPVEPYRLLKARVLYAAGDIAGAEAILQSMPSPKNSLVAEHLKRIRESVAKREPWPIPPRQDCACGAH